MKIELESGDEMRIPKGCKAIIKDGMVIVEEERLKRGEYKVGDIIETTMGQIGIVTCIVYNNTCDIVTISDKNYSWKMESIMGVSPRKFATKAQSDEFLRRMLGYGFFLSIKNRIKENESKVVKETKERNFQQ